MRDFIDISLSESIAERWQSVGWDNLTNAEREIGSVFLLQGHLFQGGLPTALKELNRDELKCVVAGLRRIAAPRAAMLMARAIQHTDERILAEIEVDLAGSEIGALRLELPDQYAASHPEKFPGPRSLDELWASMQSRGVEKKPDRLIEFERFAEADARYTDRRCSTCGQPVPEYKNKCRRCGRVYRGS